MTYFCLWLVTVFGCFVVKWLLFDQDGEDMSEYLTTTDIARICQVCDRTAAKWIDSGMLPGNRRGNRRQTTRTALRDFMERNDMPVEWLESDTLG